MPPMSTPTPPRIFNRALRAKHLARAVPLFGQADFLHQEIAKDLADRVSLVKRAFNAALLVGPGSQILADQLRQQDQVKSLQVQDPLKGATLIPEHGPEDSPLDLVISMMDLHMVDNPVATLGQLASPLQPDGLLLAAFPGEDSLWQLRQCLYQAESEICGGVHPRIIPFGHLRQWGDLLTRVGLALSVADLVPLPVRYRDPLRLLKDLRAMGETSPLCTGGQNLRRDVLDRMLALYRQNHAHDQGGVEAQFDIIVLTGWKPAPSQAKPLRPGSGQMSLQQAINQSLKKQD